MARVPSELSELSPANDRHVYWQVGVVAGEADRDATGMRTTVVTTLPQRVSANTTNYFWVGSYLADGSFIQVGYYVPSETTTEVGDAGWFYCAFYADSTEGPCVYGPLDSVGSNGALHTYGLQSSGATGLDAPMWRATMDNTVLGAFSWTVAATGTNTPTIYAESSGFVPHAPTSELGPVDFPRALAVRTSASKDYLPAANLAAIYSAPNVCPPYGISSDGHGGILLGSGLSCPDNGMPLA
jgi:hypothetical protein